MRLSWLTAAKSLVDAVHLFKETIYFSHVYLASSYEVLPVVSKVCPSFTRGTSLARAVVGACGTVEAPERTTFFRYDLLGCYSYRRYI